MIYAFVRQGEKFAECASVTDITDKTVCKTSEGLNTVTLATEKSQLLGETCQWLDLDKVLLI